MGGNTNRQLTEINAMYSKDMPFVILGNVFTQLNIRPNLVDGLFGTGNTVVNESNRRSLIYSKLQLVTNIHIDGKKARSWGNFITFLEKNLK